MSDASARQETADGRGLFFARQPVFDADGKTWGYELFYRNSASAESASFSDQDAATLAVMAGFGQTRRDEFRRGLRAMIHFGPEALVGEAPYALPSDAAVVQFPADLEPTAALSEALSRLSLAGYLLAADGFTGDPAEAALSRAADLLIIDVLGRSPEELALLAGKRARPGQLLLAKKIENQAAFQAAKAAGFDLFQGFYFQRPVMVLGRKISSNEMSKLKLLRLLSAEEPDYPALAAAVKSDPGTSLKLLQFLNSPFFGFPAKVATIERALILLGWKQLKGWLRVLLFAGASASGRIRELAFCSVQRAKFFELAARARAENEVDAERWFLLGLFSLLDAMYGAPMGEILVDLKLDESVAAALRGEKNRMSRWLEAARAFESGDWAGLDALLAELGLDAMDVARWYSDSLAWTSAVFSCGAEQTAG